MHGNPAALERFMLEEWIARHINSAHVLKPCRQTRPRKALTLLPNTSKGRRWRSG